MISQGIIRSSENIGKIYQRTHIFYINTTNI